MLIEIKVPDLAESVPDATCLEWKKVPGDYVKEGENLIDLETDKVTLEIVAPNDGVITAILKREGDLVLTGDILATLDSKGIKKASVETLNQENKPAQISSEEGGDLSLTKAGPAARKLLIENAIDASALKGTGKDGRITKEDVLKFLETPVDDLKESETSGQIEYQRQEKRVPLTRLRKRIAEKLLAAQEENALLTTFNEVDMSAIRDIRNRYREEFLAKTEAKLGFMSFFIKATVESLKSFPIVNASIDGDDVIYHSYFDIGVAVGSGKGLVVPIIKDADLLSFAQIEERIKEYGEKAQKGGLTVEDLVGGTFTISNGGVYGSLVSTPIINSPQSAILGMHKIQERPVVRDGQIVARPMMYLALTYDHRLIDGREAVQFLDYVRQCLEEPSRLLLEL